MDEAGAEVLFLVLVEFAAMVLDDEIVGGEKEPTGAGGRVADGVVGGGLDAVDDG